ncbi:MAG: methyltransferase domain-containing protein [Victivallaceae bacterium]|jgi:ubiquinone/menaquinone biosynthesis C-methylase UbiE
MENHLAIKDIIGRKLPPAPWAEGEKIPWDEPRFSRRMLQEHLSQDHDWASRRFSIIDRHAKWIFQSLLNKQPGRVLDLGCGPGLYTFRLAAIGCECKGIDFSPASIEYAIAQSGTMQVKPDYVLDNIKTAEYGSDFDLAMLLFGEFNVFSPEDAAKILEKSFTALKPGGILLIEPSTFEYVKTVGTKGMFWSGGVSGLFSDSPHLVLKETFWLEKQQVAVERVFIVDAGTAEVTRCSTSIKAYKLDELREMLLQAGFTDIKKYDTLADTGRDALPGFFAVTARKP